MLEELRDEQGALGVVRVPIDRRLLLTLREAAALMGVSESSVRRYTRDPGNPLPTVRIGGSVRIVRTELEAWIGAHR